MADQLSHGKWISALFLTGALLSFVPEYAAFAATLTYSEETKRASVQDDADLLTQSEENELLAQASELAQKTGFDIRLYTADDAEGADTQGLAEDYFESLISDGKDEVSGGCYVIDMDNRQYYLATYGDLQYYITDDRLESLLDDAWEKISEGDYAGTFQTMLEDTERYYSRGIADGTTIYNEDTGEYTVYHAPRQITRMEGVVSALIAGVVFLISFLSVTVRYGMKGRMDDGYSVRDNVSLKLSRQDDRFVNHFVTTRRIPRNDDHGSGGVGHSTTTHTTGGGYSAGGGGRSF